MKIEKIQHPKVVVIGAGSLFFGRQAIWQMVTSPYLNQGTLALVDIDEEKLEKMVKLAKMAAEYVNVKLKIEGSTKRKDVLEGADFVVLSFAKDTVKYRGIDCAISEKYGVRMCSGDIIGPGGIFRAMRELPVILECARDIEAICPDAWVINYINPNAVNGIGLRKYAPNLKSFALCDGHHMPHVKKNYAIRAGIIKNPSEYTEEISKKFDLKIAGINHFTWLIKVEFDGKDLTRQIAESLKTEAAKETDGGDIGAKAVFNNTIGYELYKAFGYIPTCVAHTKEYVPFWQAWGKTAGKIPPLSIWETEARYKRHEEMWSEVDSYITGKLSIHQFIENYKPDHATDIIENMVGNLGKPFYINTYNKGSITNMKNDAFLELCCQVTMDGIKPYSVGEMPKGIRGMQEIVLDTHELTAEAIYECNYDKLRRAFLTDPLICSIVDADNIIKELLQVEREALPECW